MAVLELHSPGAEVAYLLQPNRSLKSGQICLAGAVIGAALLGVTIYFSMQGAWMIIPFTGLEAIVLVTALYLQCKWSKQQQLVEIDDTRVYTSIGRNADERSSFPRGWLKVALIKAPCDWHPKRLVIGSHGRFVEIGAFLEESERERLAATLRSTLQ
ncbi:MAG: DUF2244 domain-containing protein [Gammaproteobacteria bacterium]|nr:DUF2244 domain-containing protein [Gammaproteobacteria bacterium]MCB1849398.1 DUF2244 domain-containing protein [Gammaproteobacteria bacterium]MCP5416224.1 DUF2244 domain-containing protein [Chromatiaceae bacterium]